MILVGLVWLFFSMWIFIIRFSLGFIWLFFFVCWVEVLVVDLRIFGDIVDLCLNRFVSFLEGFRSD